MPVDARSVSNRSTRGGRFALVRNLRGRVPSWCAFCPDRAFRPLLHRTMTRRSTSVRSERAVTPLALLLAAATAGGVAASPPQRVVTPAQHVSVTGLQAAAEIVDGIATTELEATFRNHTGAQQEATWILPIPEGSTADGFTMTMGGKEMEGEVLDAGNARRVYEDIVRRRRDPGLLEYFGQGCLRARIFPIEPGAEARVKVRLRSVLTPRSGLYTWTLPLRALRATGLVPARVGADVQLRGSRQLGGIFAPDARMDVRRKSSHEARASIELAGGCGERDVVLQFAFVDGDVGMTLLANRASAAEPGHFLLWLAPTGLAEAIDSAKVRKHVQFVLDTSGSMQGRKIEQAKAALRFFVRSLAAHDRFNIVPFATEAEPFFAQPAEASATAVEQALAKIDRLVARGGTNIEDALRRALTNDAPAGGSVPLHDVEIVVFLTDGEPTVGTTDRDKLLEVVRRANQRKQRLFVFGVGNSLDAKLLDGLAEQNGGARDYVGEDEDIELATADLLTKLSHPVLTDLSLEIDGCDVFAVSPQRIPDLFKGSEIWVAGRYRAAGAVTIRLCGQVLGNSEEFTWRHELPKCEQKNGFVAAVWAEQRLRHLLDAIRMNGQKPELVEEVKRLAKEYGIVTQFTSHLILEEGMRLAGDELRAQPPVRDGADPRFGRGAGEIPTAGSAGPALRAGAAPTAEGSAVDSRRRLDELGQADAGGRAVAESKATRRGFLDDRAKDGRNEVQATTRAAGRTFYRAGDAWIDSACASDWAAKAEPVTAFSPEYFALLAAHPELKEAFALGAHVVLRVDERILEVKPAAEPKTEREGTGGQTDGARKIR